MNPKVSVFIATSLDGYIAREDGDLNWLDDANKLVPEGEDCGYGAFMRSVDVLVMGRVTFEKILSFANWPYGDKPVIVLSRNTVEIPNSIKNSVTHSCETPEKICLRLFREGVKRIYLDGGVTIQRFMAVGLVNDITITLIPTILGRGKPLFGPVDIDVSLKHIATKTFEFGFVQITYEIEVPA